MKQHWISDNRKNLICVDSYDEGVLKGRVYGEQFDVIHFSSLSQFLVRMEEMLDENEEMPQSFTSVRRFSDIVDQGAEDERDNQAQRKGAIGTFELGILFRQNTSWQGTLKWREKGMEQSFRSVLELVLLLDSALRPESLQ